EPTAQMSLAERAERLVRRAGTSDGTGADNTLHCVPFQCSMSSPPLPPTTQTLLEATAATAKREPLPAGLGTILQAEPSQCMINRPEPVSPTAQASLGERAATPCSSPPSLPTAGLGTIFHAAPSQRSIKGSDLPVELMAWPTAQVSVPEVDA